MKRKSKPNPINPLHEKEWIDSCVAIDLIHLNVISLTGDATLEHLLYALPTQERRNDGRLRDVWIKRYSHCLNGGWWCYTIDIKTLEQMDWGCFKPDQPIESNGKKIKYEHPPKVETGVFCLKVPLSISQKVTQKFPALLHEKTTGNPDWFWKTVTSSSIPVCITEGAKKTGTLLSAGYAAIGLPGVWNGSRKEPVDLIPQFKELCKPGREIIFCFDQDTKEITRRNVALAIARTGNLFQELGVVVSVMVWNPLDGKGIDDVCACKGIAYIDQLFSERVLLEDYLKTTLPFKSLRHKFEILEFINYNFANRLKYNQLTSRVELDGKSLELNGELSFMLAEEYKVDISRDGAIDAFSFIAKKYSYHPVRFYLEKLKGTETISIDDLAKRYLGNEELIYQIFVKKWLIAAVARIFEPGCKVDFALILQGSQNIGKSTFFRILGGDFFDDSFGNNLESNKGLCVLHRSWIQEWAEFDRVTSKSDFSLIKAFLTRQVDCFVKPYGRDAIDYPRMCVLCGSINKISFLRDETGDRRFLVIPLSEGHKIPIALLQEERDKIWAKAVQEYFESKAQGEAAWNLSESEYASLNVSNSQFRVDDEWEPFIERFLVDIDRITVSDILSQVFDIPLSEQDRKVQMRVTEILTKLGWKKGPRLSENKQKKQYWIPSGHTLEEEDIPLGGGMSNVCPTSNPATIKGLPPSDIPDIPKPPKKKKKIEDFPSPAFRPGDLIKFEDKVYTVVQADHAWVMVEGREKAIHQASCELVVPT